MVNGNDFDLKAHRLIADLETNDPRGRADASNLLRNELNNNPGEALALVRTAQRNTPAQSPEHVAITRSGAVVIADRGGVQQVGSVPIEYLQSNRTQVQVAQVNSAQMYHPNSRPYSGQNGQSYNTGSLYEGNTTNNGRTYNGVTGQNGTNGEYEGTAYTTAHPTNGRTYNGSTNGQYEGTTNGTNTGRTYNGAGQQENVYNTYNTTSTNNSNNSRVYNSYSQTNQNYENNNNNNNNYNRYGQHNNGQSNVRIYLNGNAGYNGYDNGYNNGYNNGQTYNGGYNNGQNYNVGNQIVQRLASDLVNGQQDDAARVINYELNNNQQRAIAEISAAQYLAGPNAEDKVYKMPDNSVVVRDQYSGQVEYAGSLNQQYIPGQTYNNGQTYNGYNNGQNYDGYNNGQVYNNGQTYDGGYNNGQVYNNGQTYDGYNNGQVYNNGQSHIGLNARIGNVGIHAQLGNGQVYQPTYNSNQIYNGDYSQGQSYTSGGQVYRDNGNYARVAEHNSQILAAELSNGQQQAAASFLRRELSINPQQALNEIGQAERLVGQNAPEQIVRDQSGNIAVLDSNTGNEICVGPMPQQNQNYSNYYANNGGAGVYQPQTYTRPYYPQQGNSSLSVGISLGNNGYSNSNNYNNYNNYNSYSQQQGQQQSGQGGQGGHRHRH